MTMQIDDSRAERMGASLEALNARIARLAMALDVALDDQSAVETLMAAPLAKDTVATLSDNSQIREEDSAHVTPEHRKAHQLEELRGLLMLRYHLEANSVNDNGLTLTRQLLVAAEAHLVSQGFKPGADGLGLDHLFDVP